MSSPRSFLTLFISLIYLIATCHAAPAFHPPTRANGFDNRPQRTLLEPTQSQQPTGNLTNAEKLARGLPLNKPERLYKPSFPRALQPRQSKR
ncbi:hypothetical protein I203_103788 [Kwoniella mangroviensis CBS 8507]|uniref:uncharacterized protein n=1 Tax=Kwoniella mangroviensis CBS 8507 TaxID=1296122 RepID=UPI00080CFECD|nr:uncharacterized protein I203_04119 [Kwoniella mangroviensis CBS 8507]OCF66543.1 hypothetical protein I203_04119 [Kwoniella mangroviensis CBS 8507]